MSESLLPTIIQFPLLAVFIWFSVEMQKRYHQSIDDYRRQEADERVKRDQQWREFLLDQRQAQTASLESQGTTLQQMAAVLSALSANNIQMMRYLESLNERMERMVAVQSALGMNVTQVVAKLAQHDQRAEEIFNVLSAHDAATTRRRKEAEGD